MLMIYRRPASLGSSFLGIRLKGKRGIPSSCVSLLRTLGDL